jgi:hypothetical protein
MERWKKFLSEGVRVCSESKGSIGSSLEEF